MPAIVLFMALPITVWGFARVCRLGVVLVVENHSLSGETSTLQHAVCIWICRVPFFIDEYAGDGRCVHGW